jgi:AcrR family transcriptional regulator
MKEKTLSPKRRRTQKALIAAAREIVGEKGFHRASLDEIAARAGLTKGAIYDNFDGKDELFLAVVTSSSRERLEKFPWPTNRRGALKTRLRRLAEAIIADAPAWKTEAPLRAEFLLYSLTHEELREQLSNVYDQRIKSVGDKIRQSVADEELPISTERFVLLLEALIPGLMYMRMLAPELMSDEAITEIMESFAGKS